MDVISYKLLPKQLIASIPGAGTEDVGMCECGGELQFNESLTTLRCSNKRCFCRVAARLVHMCKKMDCYELSIEDAKAISKQFKIISPFQVFKVWEDGSRECEGVADFKHKLDQICDPSKRRMRLWEMVEASGFPEVASVAYKLFNGYRTIEEAYSDFEKNQVPFIAEKLGIKKSEASVIAYRIYSKLLECKSELVYGETKFEIYNPIGDILNIVISGNVNGYGNKSEFIREINFMFGHRVTAVMVKAVSEDIDVLITDSGDISSKIKTATKINERAINETGKEVIKIMSSSEYLRLLRNKYGETDMEAAT